MDDRPHSLPIVVVDPDEHALLKATAECADVNLGNFIRCKVIEATETQLLERRLVNIPAEHWDRIERWFETPPRDIPALRRSSAIPPVPSPRPLTNDDNRYAFDCQREPLNRWFWDHAWQDQETDIARTHVAADPATGNIIGFASLSAAEIKREPPPSDGIEPQIWLTALPAVLLGRLAINQRYQGLGHARSLMRFALASAVSFSSNIGCFCMLTHPLDDQVRTFLRTFGFEEIPGDPAGGMAIRIIDLEHNGVGSPSTVRHNNAFNETAIL
ncbi:hypothetical protein sphantq_00665 [Sphingobium sp. AntQ-1]|uniref:GNAT family N-acetyltransferase n=1 Tax=Sphingobium sp. AntQ-1 TaxID=2930091 RepID=UPI00234F12CA|nr:GNAT family N-acetyltransferase [Sphingobium sp. AntQ-1]WCP12268.1 hypothetical protein sphantq_00665 [Sphingobium sp. AntQ-1]